MYLVAIAWIYVVLMMAVAEAMSTQGTVLGGVITFLLYGVLPLSIVMYVLGSPMRRRALRAAEQAADVAARQAAGPAMDAGASAVTAAPSQPAPVSGLAPDSGSQTTGGQAQGLLAPERKEV